MLLEARERVVGLRYERVVVTRLDFDWLAPHPPLEMMTSRCAHVPFGEDGDDSGVNDCHAVLNRKHATRYLSRWDDIVSGKIMRTHPGLRLGVLASSKHLSAEGFLSAHLRHYRVPLCRFAPIAYRACCASGAREAHVRPARDRCHQSTCFEVKAALSIRATPSAAQRAEEFIESECDSDNEAQRDRETDEECRR